MDKDNKDFPYIYDTAWKNGKVLHPGCRHTFRPVDMTDVDDDKKEEMKEFSNRAFELSPEDEKMLKKYYDDQKKKAKVARDTNSYNELADTIGKENLPSLEEFVKIKEEGGEEWDRIKELEVGGVDNSQDVGYNSGGEKPKVKAEELNNFVGLLKGEKVTLSNVKVQTIEYIKRSSDELVKLRKVFNSSKRKGFLKYLTSNGSKVTQLKKAGLTDLDIQMMKDGYVPKGYQVHHKLPLDGGGTNSIDNLILIKNDPYHKVITNTQNSLTRGLGTGDSTTIDNWPIPEGYIYPNEAEME